MEEAAERAGKRETIRERIERETSEQIEAGRGKHSVEYPDVSADYVKGSGVKKVEAEATRLPLTPSVGDFHIEARADAHVIYDRNGKIAGAEITINGEPYLQLGLPTPSKDDGTKVAAEPGSWTAKAIADISSILGVRGFAYTTTDEFENFENQAKMAETTERQIFRGMLGQKLTRERSCWLRIVELTEKIEEAPTDVVELELKKELQKLYLSWEDSIRDVCGYGLLWFGFSKRWLNAESWTR